MRGSIPKLGQCERNLTSKRSEWLEHPAPVLDFIFGAPMFCNAQLHFAMQHGVLGCMIPEGF
jgi:hypothetical protein